MAMLLAAIAAKPYIDKPEPVAKAEAAPFVGVQFSKSIGAVSFFDTRTGEVWVYNDESGAGIRKDKLIAIGQALVKPGK